MPDMSNQAAPAKESSPLIAAWLVLIGMGATSMTYQIYHLVKYGHMNVGLALLAGVVPVFVAMCLSHIVAVYKGGTAMKAVAFAIMAAAMALSIGAVGEVVRQAFGPYLCWLFGALLDGAALVALRVILSERERRAARETALETADRTAREATAEAARLRADLQAAEAAREATISATEEAIRNAVEEAMRNATTEPSRGPSGEPQRMPRAASRAVSKDPDAERARREYRKSVSAGAPLSDRALGDMFERSRTWGASRIREADAGPQLAAAQ